MALPDDQVKSNFDQGTDDPKKARKDFDDNVVKFNALKRVLGNGVELDVGDGLKDDSGNLTIDRDTDSGLEISATQLRLKTGADSGIKRSASDAGIEVDIAGTTEETTIDALADFILVDDTSAGAKRKVKTTNIIARPTKTEAETGADNVKSMTPLRTDEAIQFQSLKQEIFIDTGNYDVPLLVTQLYVVCIGGGGGGGGGNFSQSSAGGGGGGWSEAIVSVAPSESLTVTIGAGGPGGTGSGGPGTGTPGGATTFEEVTGNGGGGGQGGGASPNPGLGGTGGAGSSFCSLANNPGGDGTIGNNSGGKMGLADHTSGDNTHTHRGHGGTGHQNNPIPGGDGIKGMVMITPLLET